MTSSYTSTSQSAGRTYFHSKVGMVKVAYKSARLPKPSSYRSMLDRLLIAQLSSRLS